MSSLTRMLRLAELYFRTKDEGSFKQVCTQFDSYIKRHAHMEPKQDKNQPNPWKRNMDYAGYENSPYYGSVSEFLKKFPGGIKEWVVWREKTKGDRNSMYDDLLSKPKVKRAAIDVEDLTFSEEEYEPTSKEVEESQKSPTAEETVKSKTLVEKILEELVGDGLVSKEDIEEWRKSQPLKTEQRKENPYECEVCGDTRPPVSEYGEWPACPGCGRNADDIDKKAHYEPVGGDDVDKFEKEKPLYSDRGLERFKSVKEFLKQYRRDGQSADDAALKAAKDMVDYWKLLLKGKKRRKQKGKK